MFPRSLEAAAPSVHRKQGVLYGHVNHGASGMQQAEACSYDPIMCFFLPSFLPLFSRLFQLNTKGEAGVVVTTVIDADVSQYRDEKNLCILSK